MNTILAIITFDIVTIANFKNLILIVFFFFFSWNIGSHEYIEVIASTASRKKQIAFLIELEFRDQFKIAKACDEYHKLTSQLPEYYIGKPDYLNAIVRVLCDAAKKSMKEKKIHMGPWRKRSFMQMKWSGSSERSSCPDDEFINKLSTLSFRQASESCLHVNASPAVVVT